MEQLSFFEKLGVLGQNILAHPFFIGLLFLPVIIIFFNKKITKKAIVIIYIVVLAVILFIGNTTIFELFDNLMDNIFLSLYFPNFITLFLVEVLSAIICLITFLKKDINKVNKVINIVGFAIIQTIFALVLTVIQANNIDIYKENALYANNDVLTLMQLMMGTFALQILTLVVVWGIDRVTERLDAKEKGEIINRHQMRLPEGRITHAKLSDKVIIREPKVIVKEPEVIIKEPEVKLDSHKPVKPLDKSLIEDVRINPLDLNEAVIKEKNKPKKIEEVLTKEEVNKKSEVIIREPEVKLDVHKKVKPLDKSIIKEEKIVPRDLNEEIAIQKNKSKLKEILPVNEVKEENSKKVNSVNNRFKQYMSRFKDKKVDALDVVFDNKVNESNKIINDINKESKFVNSNLPKEKPDLLKPMGEEFNNVKVIEPKEDVSSVLSFKPEFPNEVNNVMAGKPKDIDEVLKPSTITPEETLAPVEVLKPKARPKQKEEKELITNLEIIDFDKTVKAIKDLKIVYTL